MCAIGQQAALLQREWDTSPRWAGITRDFSAHDVLQLRGRGPGQEYGSARRAAARLWDLLHDRQPARAHGVQVAAAGSPGIYLPGWQSADGDPDTFELMTVLAEAGAAGLRLIDQLAPGEGRKVLVPTGQHIRSLTAARRAADVLGVPALLIARTAACEASLLTSDTDERDHEFLTGERTADGLHQVAPGLYACVTRALAFAPYADLLWLENPTPDLAWARAFANVIHSQHPGKPLAYSYRAPAAPSLPDDEAAAAFHRELAALGYRLISISPAGFRAEPAPALAYA